MSSDTGGTWRFGWLEPAGEYILAFIFSRAAAVSAQPVQVTSSAASSSADHSTHVCVYVAMGMHRKLAHARPEADSERVSALAGFSIALSGGNDEESEEARPLFEELVAITRREYGDRHPGTLSALHSFGLHLCGRGDTEGAVPLLKEALSGMQRLGAGGSDEVTLRCKSDLAAAYARSMQFAAARQLFEEATVEARRTRPTCEATFVAMGNFGDAIFNIGDHATALLLREEASASACRVLGAAHTTAKVLTRLANDTQQNVIGRASSKDTRAVGTLVGLTYASTAELNGRDAFVVGFDTTNGLYHVQKGDPGEAWRSPQEKINPTNIILKQGTAVIVEGLQTAPEWNGKRGLVESFNEQSGRYTLRVEGRKPQGLNVKLGHCRLESMVEFEAAGQKREREATLRARVEANVRAALAARRESVPEPEPG